MAILNQELDLIFKYLIGQSPSENQIKEYLKGIKELDLELNQTELNILEYGFKYHKLTGILDTGLSLYRKEGNLKKRFLLATAIIECDPKHTNLFLNEKKTQFLYFKIIVLGTYTIFSIISSYILFGFKKWK